MSLSSWSTGLLAATAVLVALRPRAGRSIRGTAAAGGQRRKESSSPLVALLTSHLGRGLGGAMGGLGVALVVGGPVGLGLGVLVGVIVARALGRLVTRSAVRRREQVASHLPLAGELLSAALASGADPRSALRAVGAAVGAPLGDSLEQVARALDLGSSPADAWCELLADPVTAALARPMVRASISGAPTARSLSRMSAELRRQAHARAAGRAEVVGVRAVGPLGLCFLPAFVVLGVVPFIAGSVHHLLAG